MNKSVYTLGRLKSEVFRALDEYSSNGLGHEIFSGGTGDIDKRFSPALNSAIRLILLSSARQEKTCLVALQKPEKLMAICDFSVAGNEKRKIMLPLNSGAVSFDFSGNGSFFILDSGEGIISEHKLSTEYGNIENCKKIIQSNAVCIEFTASSEEFLSVSGLYSYNISSVRGCLEEKFLPDGKRVFCAFPPRCAEICSVSTEKRGRRIPCPSDIFNFSEGLLSCEEKYSGNYNITYCEYPEEIPENASPDTELSLSPAAFGAAVYAVAAELCAREDGEMYSRLTYKYREMLANTYPVENYSLKNSFFAGGLFGRRKKGRNFFR